MNNSKYILITGVCGMIGANFAEWVLRNHPEYTVVGIDNLEGGYLDNMPLGVILYIRDLAKDDIDDIFDLYRFEYVFHFAAYAAEGLSPFMRRFNYSNNIGSTVNVINNCITYDVNRLVYTSSMSVYGHGIGDRFVETQTPCPIDPYGISKYACEMDIRVANDQHGLDYCIIRPHNFMGRLQNIWDKYRNVLGIWMRQILDGQKISVFGDGLQTRAFSFVDDAMPYFWKCAVDDVCSAEIFNLGGLDEIRLVDAARMLCDVAGYDESNIVFLEQRHEVKYAVPCGDKSVEVLGFEQKTSLRDALTTMWNWAKEQPKREVKKWDKYEIEKGIYGFWK